MYVSIYMYTHVHVHVCVYTYKCMFIPNLYSIFVCLACFSNHPHPLLQIYHEAIVEEEKEKQFVAQAFPGGMKHGGGSRHGSAKHNNWPRGAARKGDRDRNRREKDQNQYRERDRDRDRDKPKEKLDARKILLLLKHREKKDLGVGLHVYMCVIEFFFFS